MIRFAVILLVFLALAPLVPILVEKRLGSQDTPRVDSGLKVDDTADTGERIYRISRNGAGHFVAEARLNGTFVDMLVDTGATVTVLPESVAEDIGIFLSESDFTIPIRTANGTARGARTVIDGLRLGDIRLDDIDALVLKDVSLGQPLLGMSVLNRLERFDMSGGTLVLVQ
ncbi:TIGR02281 family clan AA aspartic protease [Labrenzia sp. VG12]|uniref:retropepsin-like aspartic protease family protein n=1 Tax=Labrenzia sp. VG12 TaxID=2021862 RepID=UPI000B8BFE71|nr:TIGR02281 family clan AA aspartic protease [Labrenzia sp. VG12]ASP35961.1 TIGR02281 family clan AA aspartic protease [Labrenzia sp. VG12]